MRQLSKCKITNRVSTFHKKSTDTAKKKYTQSSQIGKAGMSPV